MMLIDGQKPTMPFQMVDMVEVPTEVPVEESAERFMVAVQEISTIWEHIHDKAVKNIKWAQEKQAQDYNRQYQVKTTGSME